jgi:hypothetical protein
MSTPVDIVESLDRVDCPLADCKGYCMQNSRTDKHFPTCFHHRQMCPGLDGTFSCGRKRGMSEKDRLYPLCAKCKFGDSFKTKKPSEESKE